MNNNYDIAIVGGGIVGIATAYQLQKKKPHQKIVVFEKEDELAFHQTGRNSGVIHSGLYYKPGSKKAHFCVEGRNKLINFCKKNKVSHDICGKIIVAVNDEESARLSFLKRNGELNGLIGLRLLDPLEFKNIEPNVEGVRALFVPHSGIVNYKDVTQKLAERVVSINEKSSIMISCKVLDYKDGLIKTTKGKFYVNNIIFCGGLFSDRLAMKDKVDIGMRIVGFRGDYYQLSEDAKNKIKNLIYPVPNPEFPFLGVHFTRMIDGSVECGPNAVFTFKREGYNKMDFNLMDAYEALSFSGTHKLFINHWKFGLDEYKRAFSKSLFLKELQKMVPSLKMSDIVEARSGVRAIALSEDGNVLDEFKIVRNKNNIHVLNAPSPAATACLSIGDKIVQEAEEYFNI